MWPSKIFYFKQERKECQKREKSSKSWASFTPAPQAPALRGGSVTSAVHEAGRKSLFKSLKCVLSICATLSWDRDAKRNKDPSVSN